ncbi:hypothetical protein T01_9583 [Trichinella spiralis]|uniref:Uncharacterized protein n=2 Tax=Trichinella spiralis TaxID=6334 RepID=A0A0V1B7U1_TRISP|nr:hypothetical protein T01_9583 [Trichinella spiralis]
MSRLLLKYICQTVWFKILNPINYSQLLSISSFYMLHMTSMFYYGRMVTHLVFVSGVRLAFRASCLDCY